MRDAVVAFAAGAAEALLAFGAIGFAAVVSAFFGAASTFFSLGFFGRFFRCFFGVFFAAFLVAFLVAFFTLFLLAPFLAFLVAARFAAPRGAFRAFFVFRFLTVFFAPSPPRIPL